MKKYLSAFLLVILLILPAALLVGASYYGNSYPIEGKVIDTPQFLTSKESDLSVVFFGFVGCASVCPNSLTKLGTVLDSIGEQYPNKSVGAVFVDIRKQTDSLSAVNYGYQFSDKIRGTYIPQKDRQQVIEDFSLQIKPADNQLPLLHTDHFFLLEKQESDWKILRVLANSTDVSNIKQIFRESLN